jgi:hypothetical protein
MKDYPDFDGTQACAAMGTDFFYPVEKEGSKTPSDSSDYDYLRAICRSCKFIDACYIYALKYERFGFWGGSTEAQRTQARRRLGIHVINPSTLL